MQSSSAVAGTFFEMPSVIVLAAAADWDRDGVRGALGDAAGKLWTTSRLGAGWVAATAGRHPVERLDGLGRLMFTTRGRLLLLGNDPAMLAAVLDRAGAAPPGSVLTYAAGFRHARERANFERVMTALDFGAPGQGGGPSLFSGNIAGLSRALARIVEIRVTELERGNATVQTVVYRLAP